YTTLFRSRGRPPSRAALPRDPLRSLPDRPDPALGPGLLRGRSLCLRRGRGDRRTPPRSVPAPVRNLPRVFSLRGRLPQLVRRSRSRGRAGWLRLSGFGEGGIPAPPPHSPALRRIRGGAHLPACGPPQAVR